MLSLLRNRFGIPGVISVIALVFAMFGGAYAASNDGGGKATASAKAKKGPRGPKGAKGDTGPAGPAGPAGAQGSAGANGKDGSSGANGKSVAVTELGPGECNNGEAGALFTVGGEEVEACNGEEGEEGEQGADGSPWTLGGTLPQGATETGSFAYAGEQVVPISFAIPLPQALDADHVHRAPDANCPGTVADPKAAAGQLCIYTSAGGVSGPYLLTSTSLGAPSAGADKSGALLFTEGESWGSWAVSGP